MNTILLTGSTGNLGSRILAEFLKRADVRFVVLVFAKDQEDADAQIDSIFAFWNIEPSFRVNVEVVRGDMTAGEFLGIVPEVYNNLTKKVTHIIHCAANFKLDLSLDEARTSIVDGTKNLVLFSKKCQESSLFKRFNYVSSLDAAGDMSGIIKEEFFGGVKRNFLNTYQIAKAEAEEYLKREYDTNQFPITVYRPSMLVGDSKNGKIINPQSMYHIIHDMFLEPESMLLPGKNFRVDPMPIDFLAEGIFHMYDANETNGNVYHFVSGKALSLTLPQFIFEVKKIYTKNNVTIEKIPLFISPHIPFIVLSFLHLVTFGSVRKKINAQKEMVRYFFINAVPDNTQMRLFLESRGLKIPHLAEYLPVLCEYMIREHKDLAQLQIKA